MNRKNKTTPEPKWKGAEFINIEKYIADRVDSEIQWYSKKSKHCQNMYKGFQVAEIILASLIPLLSSYSEKSVLIAFMVGLFGAIIAIIESITKLYKYHENWIQYRTTCELLKYQKYLYLTKSYPYNNSDETVENIFVKNVESIISSENNQWKTMNVAGEDNKKGNHSSTNS